MLPPNCVMKKLIIIRGPSGSGKTTTANKLLDTSLACEMFETDDFWSHPNGDGEYIFDTKLLSKAHEWNRLEVERYMFHNVEQIIVSNTSTQLWEIEAYLELAKEYDYEVKIIRTPGPWDPEVLAKRNVHKVPKDIIERQIRRYEKHKDEQEYSA